MKTVLADEAVLILCMHRAKLREIFKKENRDFLHPGTRRGGGGRGGEKKDTKVF